MFRRARLNVRPNVRPVGRGTSSTTGPESQGPAPGSEQGSGVSVCAEVTTAYPPTAPHCAGSDDKAGNLGDAAETGKPAETTTQRRRRISTLPNHAKPRAGPSASQCSATKLQRRASQVSDGSALLPKESSPSEKSNGENSSKPSMLPEKKTPVPQVPQFSPLKKSVSRELTACVSTQKNDDNLQKNIPSPLKERPTQERSGTQEENLPTKPASIKENRICSDRERILKARKLREMLKEELKKERMLKHRPPVIEGRSPPDRSKMTMRDLIYYLPENNPMKSSLAEEKRTERSSAPSQMKEQEDRSTPDHEQDDEDEEAENEEESQDGPLLVPRVKVAEDGSIILDEESLTVEVLRTKGPCVVEENDPIFERGSTTTYSSFRKSFYTKPWSNKETDMFFLAISMVGTDFSLIGRLFPHRARAEIKNKFKREEKANGWRIDKAFKEKRPFDFELFAQLLEKVLADEEKRKQKHVKSQKPKEKKSSRPRKKLKAKAASTEAANDQDDLQEARVSDAETEADAVLAEKENEESLGISEQTEEQVALESALAKKKKKKKRKDEHEVEYHPEEMAVPSKISKEGKLSKTAENKVVCDAKNDDGTTCREEWDTDETSVTEEEKLESCLPVDDIIERESNVTLCSFEKRDNVILEKESAKLRILDARDDTSKESQILELPVSKIASKENQPEEIREAKNKEMDHLCRPVEKQSASENDSQFETQTKKLPHRRCLQRPKPNLVGSSGRKEAGAQEKMDAETYSPNLVNADEKSSEEDNKRNRNESVEAENMNLDTKSEQPEKTVIAKKVVGECQQKFKPNVTRASVRKEEPEKSAGNDRKCHLEPKEETQKNSDYRNGSGDNSEQAAEKDDKVLESVSESNKTVRLQQDSEPSVLKPAPLKRGRMQRPKPNLGRNAARQKELTDGKDPEEEKSEGVEAEKGVMHHKNGNSGPCLKKVMKVHEDTQPRNVMLEEDISTDSETSVHTRQCSREQSSEAESCESDKLSVVLTQSSDFSTGESCPQTEEKKNVGSSAWLLRSRFQKPKPNLRTTRKEMLDVNSKSVSQKDTNKEESFTQYNNECNVLSDTDKARNYEAPQPLESLGKEKSFGSQCVSESPSCKSPNVNSRPENKQHDTSTTDDGKNTSEEESKQTPHQPVQLVRSRFCRHKPNLVKAVGRKELQISENDREKNPDAEQFVLQNYEPASAIIDENEAVLRQTDVSRKQKQEQKEVHQVPSISENILCEQICAENSTFQEGKVGAMRPGQFVRDESLRTTPNLKRACREEESPVTQKLAAPVEKEANRGENLPVAEESEEPLSSKDAMEGNMASSDNIGVNPESFKSEAHCSEKSPNCHSKGDQEEHLSTCVRRSNQDPTERFNEKLSFGEENKQNVAKSLCQVKAPHGNPKPNLMRVPRKRYYPEECENREEDNTRNRNAKECLMLENTGVSMAASKNSSTDSEEPSCRRTKQDSSFQYPEMSSESDSQVEQDGFQLSTTEETSSDCLIRRQSRRSSKWIAQTKHASELRTSSTSEYEVDLISEKESQLQVKLSVSRGKCLKTKHRMKYEKEHRSSKVTLVTLRASQEEEEDEEADDFEPEYEDICFAPEEVNKAPVFVPLALRSPKPNSVQIEETVEELEIFMNVPDVPVVTEVESLSHASVQPVIQMEKNETTIPESPEVDKGINDGSTEAAMTLLAMGDPMFQLKTSTEERIDMLTAQDELDVACSLETHDYSQQDTTSSQRLLSPDTSAKEFVPSEDGSNISVEDQQDADTRIGVEEYFERNAADTSRSFTEVNSVRLTGGSLLMPEPAFGVLNSDENTIPKSPNTNILVEKLEQVQTASTTPDIPKMHYVALDQTRPAAADSSVLHDFVTGSMEPIRQADKTKRTEKEVINSCGNSGDLRPVTASLEPEKSHLEPEDCPSRSSVDGIPEPNCCPLQHDLCTISFTQNEALAQDTQKQCVSSAEEISVANNDHRCPEEEQTFILTLVEIPADSKEFHASALLAQASEPLLPAPILINSINASETSTPEEESTGSLIASAGEFVTHLNSSLETNLLHSASVGSIPNLQTTQKRSAAELEENDFRPAKRTMSTDAVEGILEDTHKGYSIKSPSVPMTASGNAFQRTEASANEVFVSESTSQLAERSQLETLETLENSASKQEGEVMSRLTSNTKAEISGQEKQKDVCESGQLEHAGSLASSSSTPLLRGGRKPLGFLSLICKKSNSESAEDTKGKRGKTPKPRVVALKRNLKKPTLSTKEDRESCSLPSASTPLSSSSSVLYENVAADAAVTVPSNKPSEKPPPSAKDQEKEEEPTRISEYFFSDIFMEVDDSE